MVTRPHPAWDQMTPEQKFAFLNEWAENLTNANRSLQIELHSFLGKVLSVESKISNLKQQLNRNSIVS
jgi:hypothetical protein